MILNCSFPYVFDNLTSASLVAILNPVIQGDTDPPKFSDSNDISASISVLRALLNSCWTAEKAKKIKLLNF